MTTIPTNRPLTDDECRTTLSLIGATSPYNGDPLPYLAAQAAIVYDSLQAIREAMNQAEQTADLGAFMDAEEQLKRATPTWRRVKQLYLFAGGDLFEITGGR